jgi:hypothetical protein
MTDAHGKLDGEPISAVRTRHPLDSVPPPLPIRREYDGEEHKQKLSKKL